MPVADHDIVEVAITREIALEAKIYAEKALEDPGMRAASIRRGMHGENTIDTKLAWRQGELAVHAWFFKMGIPCKLPLDPTGGTDEYDLMAKGFRTEVKTKNFRWWPRVESWYLLVPEDQRSAHIRKGIERYVCACVPKGRGVVLLIGWCGDAFFRRRARTWRESPRMR